MHVPIAIDDQESVAVRRKILSFPSDAQGEPEKRGFASTVVCAKQVRDATTILIVDDNTASRLVLTALFSSAGYRVLAAHDGAEGLNLARTGRPELVISDVIMPVIDGYEFVRQLRRDPLTTKTAVIFYTAGYNTREARSLAEACGVSHVLAKPSGPEEILRAVSAALAGSAPPAVPLSDANFADTHRRMLTNKLSEKVDELQATHLAYQNIFDHAIEGIFQSTPQGTYVTINPALARIYGYDSPAEAREQINDIRRQLYVDPAQRVEFERRLREEGSVSDFETKIYRKDGTIVWVSENTRAVHNAAGEVVLYEGFVSDITKRKEAENSLRHAHAELETRIEERTSELARAREEADRANRAKSEFLLQMSHELRTPLNAVLGFAQLLEMEVNTDSARGSVEHILSGGRHLLKLINEALDIGRIEAGRFEVSIEPVNIACLLQQAINLLQPLAAQREILLMLVDPPDDAPFAQGDAQRLMFTAHETDELIREVFEIGVKSFIFKSEAHHFLVEAIQSLSQHKPFFTNKVSEVLFAEILDRSEAKPHAAQTSKRLTAREREIVQLLAEGRSNKEVAEALGISVRTAETHRASILRKLSLDSIASLVRYAIRNKMIEA